MALWNESLQPHFNRLLTRIHGMKGQSPAPQVAPELAHALILGNDRAEWAGLGHERLWTSLAVNNGPTAANLTGFGIRNPVGSGIITVITGFYCLVGASEEVHFEVGISPFTAGDALLGNVLARDTRVAAFQTSKLTTQVLTFTAAALPLYTDYASLLVQLNAQPGILPGPWPLILAPGVECLAIGGVVNTQIKGFFIGYERPVLESELVL